MDSRCALCALLADGDLLDDTEHAPCRHRAAVERVPWSRGDIIVAVTVIVLAFVAVVAFAHQILGGGG